METTILTIEYTGGVYYFDLNTNSNRVCVSWYDNKLRIFDSLTLALIWFINTHSDYKVKNIDGNYVK